VRHRLVAASSRRTAEKVASRKGSGRHWRRASRARALSLRLCGVSYASTGVLKGGLGNTGFLSIPKEAPNDMLEQTSRLLLHELGDHIAEHRTHGVETLVRSADIIETVVVQQYLLNNKDGNGLRQLRARLHNPQTKGNDLSGQEKVDDLGRVVFNKGANDSETGKAKVLEWARLRGGVEERVEV